MQSQIDLRVNRSFMTPLQSQQSLDLTFDDSGAFDINSEILAFTNLDDSIIIDPSQHYMNYCNQLQ